MGTPLLFARPECGIQRFGGRRADEENVDALGEQILNIGGLLGGVVVGVGDDEALQLVLVALGGGFDAVQHGHAPGIGEARVRKANDVGAILLVLGCVVDVDAAGVPKESAGNTLIVGACRECVDQPDSGQGTYLEQSHGLLPLLQSLPIGRDEADRADPVGSFGVDTS